MSLAPHTRLRKHADYQRVYKTGRKQFGKQMAYFFALQPTETPAEGPRVGLTVPKALGKAVDRNRIKRRMRAASRGALPLLLDAPVDVVLHPRRSVRECEYAALVREISVVFRAVQAAVERGQTAPAPADAARPARRKVSGQVRQKKSALQKGSGTAAP